MVTPSDKKQQETFENQTAVKQQQYEQILTRFKWPQQAIEESYELINAITESDEPLLLLDIKHREQMPEGYKSEEEYEKFSTEDSDYFFDDEPLQLHVTKYYVKKYDQLPTCRMCRHVTTNMYTSP